MDSSRFTGEHQKIWFIKTMKFRIAALLAVFVAATAMISRFTTMPKFETQVTEVTENYMTDSAVLAGRLIDESIRIGSKEEALEASVLAKNFADVKVGELSTSYCYIVSADGTMLYHPTADKIGKPVENDAVKQLVANIASHLHPEPSIIKYIFKDVMKYAAYYIGANSDFIVIVTADESEVLSVVTQTSKFSLIIEAVTFIVSVLCGYTVALLLSKPIVKIANAIESMSTMDLRDTDAIEKYSNRKNETGLMARSIMGMRRKLLEVVNKLNQQSQALSNIVTDMGSSASEVLHGTEQVEAAVAEIASGATSQAQETQSATDAIIVIGEKIEETTVDTNSLSESAKDMSNAGTQAMDTLSMLKKANEQTKEAIHEIYEQTSITNESALKIKEVTEVITRIASETNILSLNASIEAARAGERGKGFVVVAAQIQKLAEQSNKSAGEIKKIVDVLLNDSAKSVESMDGVKSVIEKQDEYVENTAESFRNVKSGIDKSIDDIKSIFSKTEELNNARAKVMNTVQSLSAIAEENAASTEETAASITEVGNAMNGITRRTDDLTNIAKEIDDTVGIFKI